MKFGWIFPILLLCGLLLVPDQAASAASDAAMLWWTRVLPSLLPYLITASLLERSGLLSRVPKRVVPLLLWLLGALGGYPIGAKLTSRLTREGVMTESDANHAAAFCNLPNPVFVISVVSLSVFQNERTVLPLLIGIYGVALFGLIPLFRIRCADHKTSAGRLSSGDLPAAIESGMHSILLIGGSMVIASVLGTLVQATGLLRACSSLLSVQEASLHAWLLGLVEMTGGVRAAAVLSLPLRIRLALCAGFIQFGGCSVLLQTASQIRISVTRYAVTKLIFALGSAVLTYWITPLFCSESIVETFASRADVLRNGCALLSVLLSSAVGLFAIFVLTFGFLHRKKAP